MLWEVTDIQWPYERISLHWTLRAAEAKAYEDFPFRAVRLRTLPKWTRPFHRFLGRW